MNEQPSDSETRSQTQEAAGPQEQPEQVFSDIVIWCHPKNVDNLVQAFQAHLQHADFPAFVRWSGRSGGRAMGVVVIEWEGEVSGAFTHDLRQDFEVVDFVVCPWTQTVKDPNRPSLGAAQESPLAKSEGVEPPQDDNEDVAPDEDGSVALHQLQDQAARLRTSLHALTPPPERTQIAHIDACVHICQEMKALLLLLGALPRFSVAFASWRIGSAPHQLVRWEIEIVKLKQAYEDRDEEPSGHAGETSQESLLTRQHGRVQAEGKALLASLAEALQTCQACIPPACSSSEATKP